MDLLIWSTFISNYIYPPLYINPEKNIYSEKQADSMRAVSKHIHFCLIASSTPYLKLKLVKCNQNHAMRKGPFMTCIQTVDTYIHADTLIRGLIREVALSRSGT